LALPPENSIDSQWIQPAAPPIQAPVAPVWHTVLLIMGIGLLSIAGAAELRGAQAVVNRMQTYSFTAATELCMLAWVYFGLRLRKVPFWSLLGSVSGSFRSIAIDIGLALAFWISALSALATIGLFWTVIEAAVKHQPLFTPGKQLTPDPSQQQTLHTLTQLAPANGREIAAWIGLCIIAGIAEEVVFRGYLHRQFTAWARGAVGVGVAVSALLFGMAHGYQGVRNMVMLTVFGALFSLLAVFRRSLRPGIFAHAWQDVFAGLALALVHAHHWL
jgi:membrane protease YdiL (CAAX protease family)